MSNNVLRVALCMALFFLGATGAAPAAEKPRVNSIGMMFVHIPAGSFLMGCEANTASCEKDETPQHKVSISRPFYLGSSLVTQAQWLAVMGSNPSKNKGMHIPVDNVSWNDVQVFIKKLNDKEGGNLYRLPTEAEWEYAARAGTSTRYFFGDSPKELARYAVCGEAKSVDRAPNPWGLYDIYGNLWEWVQDWYGENYYAASPATDPRGPSAGKTRVGRGGSWASNGVLCRSAYRFNRPPDYRSGTVGFRVALSMREGGAQPRRQTASLQPGRNSQLALVLSRNVEHEENRNQGRMHVSPE